jgi:hypothetical protein
MTEEKTELKEGCVLSRERAEEIVDQLFDYYMIDFDDYNERDEQEADTLGSLKSARRVLVKAVERGLIEHKIEPDNKQINRMVVYQHRMIDGAPTIRYDEFGGKALVQMKHVSDKDHVGKIHAVMGSLAGIGRASMEALHGFEHKIMQNLGTVFLAQ